MTRRADEPGADRPGKDRRDGDRRARERRDLPAPGRALVPAGPVVDAAPSKASGPATAGAKATPEAAFAAQLLGQPGQKRGLKGGPPVLGAARSAYLGAEYSGAAERRPAPGEDTDTDI